METKGIIIQHVICNYSIYIFNNSSLENIAALNISENELESIINSHFETYKTHLRHI